jgi:putative CocE/NonD family hydrolase
MRQPYGRDSASTVVYAHPVWFARHGYNVVIQDVRGRGDSEGDFYPFRHEGSDGADTIAWLRTRPESNGRIGMYGFSYQGMTPVTRCQRTTGRFAMYFAGNDGLRFV